VIDNKTSSTINLYSEYMEEVMSTIGYRVGTCVNMFTWDIHQGKDFSLYSSSGIEQVRLFKLRNGVNYVTFHCNVNKPHLFYGTTLNKY